MWMHFFFRIMKIYIFKNLETLYEYKANVVSSNINELKMAKMAMFPQWRHPGVSNGYAGCKYLMERIKNKQANNVG